MNSKRRTLIKSFFLIPMINLGLQIKKLKKKKKFKKFIWILKDRLIMLVDFNTVKFNEYDFIVSGSGPASLSFILGLKKTNKKDIDNRSWKF